MSAPASAPENMQPTRIPSSWRPSDLIYFFFDSLTTHCQEKLLANMQLIISKPFVVNTACSGTDMVVHRWHLLRELALTQRPGLEP